MLCAWQSPEICVCNGLSAKILRFNNYSSLKEELQLCGNIAANKEKPCYQQLSICCVETAKRKLNSWREMLKLCNLAACTRGHTRSTSIKRVEVSVCATCWLLTLPSLSAKYDWRIALCREASTNLFTAVHPYAQHLPWRQIPLPTGPSPDTASHGWAPLPPAVAARFQPRNPWQPVSHRGSLTGETQTQTQCCLWKTGNSALRLCFKERTHWI